MDGLFGRVEMLGAFRVLMLFASMMKCEIFLPFLFSLSVAEIRRRGEGADAVYVLLLVPPSW